jgi:hypothetical protein
LRNEKDVARSKGPIADVGKRVSPPASVIKRTPRGPQRARLTTHKYILMN